MLPTISMYPAFNQLRKSHRGDPTLADVAVCRVSACRFVKRRFNLISGDVSISSVDDAHGIQVATGDLLFLKGNAYPGMYGEHPCLPSPLQPAPSMVAPMGIWLIPQLTLAAGWCRPGSACPFSWL